MAEGVCRRPLICEYAEHAALWSSSAPRSVIHWSRRSSAGLRLSPVRCMRRKGIEGAYAPIILNAFIVLAIPKIAITNFRL